MLCTSRRRARWATVAAGLVAAMFATSCSSAGEPVADAADEPVSTTAPVTTTTTVAPTTTLATATTAASTSAPTTVAPSTSTTPSTTTTTLPVPIAPPTDIYAAEPVIELGSIEIPTIGVESTMYEGIRLTTLDYGPGHWPGSAMPGQAGNVVVGGHRTSKHQVFRDLDRLAPGDEIVFNDEGGTHTYAVRDIEIVEPSAMWVVDPTETPTVTLFACHPPGSTRQRIVVFADLVTE